MLFTAWILVITIVQRDEHIFELRMVIVFRNGIGVENDIPEARVNTENAIKMNVATMTLTNQQKIQFQLLDFFLSEYFGVFLFFHVSTLGRFFHHYFQFAWIAKFQPGLNNATTHSVG